MKKIFLALALTFGAQLISAQNYVYKVTIIRAAPDKLLDLIDLIKTDLEKYESYGVEKPYMMRHSQGDHWDLLVLLPIESLHQYYLPENVDKRKESVSIEKPYDNIIWDYIAHQEEIFVNGPDIDVVKEMFRNYDFYHVEIFQALAGKRRELLKEREMENDYLMAIGRRPNLIFNKITGSQWDNFSIGFYDDIVDYATGVDVDPIAREKAARDAGFEGADFIGSYLRRFISEHHDTLAIAVK